MRKIRTIDEFTDQYFVAILKRLMKILQEFADDNYPGGLLASLQDSGS